MSLPSPTPKQARVIWFAVTALAVATCLGLLATLLWGLGKLLNLLAPVLWPLAVAAVIACVLDPVVGFLEQRRIPRTAAVLLTFLTGLVVLFLFCWSVAPRLVTEAGLLLSRVPAYSASVQDRVSQLIAQPPRQIQWLFHRFAPPVPGGTNASSTSGPVATNLSLTPPASAAGTNQPDSSAGTAASASAEEWQQKIIRDIASSGANLLPKAAGWLLDRLVRITSLVGVLVGLALVPVYAFYLLREKKGIQSKWTDYLPVSDSRFKDELVFVLRAIQEYLVAFFRGQVLVATCDAVLYTLGFMIIGLNYAFLLGGLAQILTLIPFVGAIIICLGGVILAAVQFQDLAHPLLALGVFGVVQMLEGLVISPRIMGQRVGLHPLTILIAVMVGTTLLGGILGGILAIPLTAALRVLMFRYIWKERNPQPELKRAAETGSP